MPDNDSVQLDVKAITDATLVRDGDPDEAGLQRWNLVIVYNDGTRDLFSQSIWYSRADALKAEGKTA